MSLSFQFVLELILLSPSLDIVISVLRECREMRLYSIARESSEVAELRKLVERAIQHSHGGVLPEFGDLDFPVVRPHLAATCADLQISGDDVSVAISA
jgi:hypothetical protein